MFSLSVHLFGVFHVLYLCILMKTADFLCLVLNLKKKKTVNEETRKKTKEHHI